MEQLASPYFINSPSIYDMLLVPGHVLEIQM